MLLLLWLLQSADDKQANGRQVSWVMIKTNNGHFPSNKQKVTIEENMKVTGRVQGDSNID